MSCSDKIVKWCLLGLQGGLLSQLVAPIPLSSVIVSADARITKDRVPLGHESQREALERAIPRRVANAWVELSTLQNVDCSWIILSRQPTSSLGSFLLERLCYLVK